MTRFNRLIAISDKCTILANLFLKQNDINLYNFYKSASYGFKARAYKLSIEEGMQDAE